MDNLYFLLQVESDLNLSAFHKFKFMDVETIENLKVSGH